MVEALHLDIFAGGSFAMKICGIGKKKKNNVLLPLISSPKNFVHV